MTRLLGVTVLPEYIQVEGAAAVLDRLQAVGVNAVATSPYVMEEADEASGSREPPADAGAGQVRLLDRPLWRGLRELWVRTAPSFHVDAALYEGLRYQPPAADPLTDRQGAVVAEFLDEAKRRGLRVYFQIMAAIPPGYRVQFGGPQGDDVPQLPDGRTPRNRVANQGSLASPHLRGYQDALIADLCRSYPQLDGIRFDWPEYPPYKIDSAFVDFGPHARATALDWGLDWESMVGDVGGLYGQLHGGLSDALLAQWSSPDAWESLLAERPGVRQWLDFKARLSLELLKGFRAQLDRCGAGHVELAPSAFPPPWSLVSGMNLAQAGQCCGSVAVKLYGMHWAMMLNFYGRQLLDANPSLNEQSLVAWLGRTLDIVDDAPRPTLDDYRYPGPDEPHPIGADAQRRKIAAAKRQAGALPVHVLAHGYGPVDDVAARAAIAWQSEADGMWLNRYGYLSDDKLRHLAALVGAWRCELRLRTGLALPGRHITSVRPKRQRSAVNRRTKSP